MKLSETTVKKSNNLQLMRFVAAIMVIFAHSYAVSGSPKGTDFINRFSGEIISIGGISVTLFFLCSGYLISKSVMRTKDFSTYIKPAMLILWPYILFVLWFAAPQCSERFGKFGDISYGIYLWGFVVQQFVTYLFGGCMLQIVNFLLSCIVAVILSIVTYLIAEKPFIKKKV